MHSEISLWDFFGQKLSVVILAVIPALFCQKNSCKMTIDYDYSS